MNKINGPTLPATGPGSSAKEWVRPCLFIPGNASQSSATHGSGWTANRFFCLLFSLNPLAPHQMRIRVRLDLVVFQATDRAIHFEYGQRNLLRIVDAMLT